MLRDHVLSRWLGSFVAHGTVVAAVLLWFPEAPSPRAARGLQEVVERMGESAPAGAACSFGGGHEAPARSGETAAALCRLFLGAGRVAGGGAPAHGSGATLDARDRALFQDSGLAHLVAISGGQTGPLAAAGTAVLVGIPALALGPAFVLRRLRAARALREALLASLQLLAAFLYGATGALLRGPLFSKPVAWLAGGRAGALGGALARAVFLCLLGALIGNPFHAPSFTLSALGCECAILAARAVGALSAWERGLSVDSSTARLDSPRQRESGTARLGLLPRPVADFVAVTAATTGAMALITFPLFEGPLFEAVLANLLGVPLVGLVVTPLSLFALVAAALGASEAFLATWLAPPLSFSLGLLTDLADAFAMARPPTEGSASGSGGPTGFLRLRSDFGVRYLGACLALLWAVSEATTTDARAALRTAFRRTSTRTPPP